MQEDTTVLLPKRKVTASLFEQDCVLTLKWLSFKKCRMLKTSSLDCGVLFEYDEAAVVYLVPPQAMN